MLGFTDEYNHGCFNEGLKVEDELSAPLNFHPSTSLFVICADIAEALEKRGTVGSTGVELTVKWNTISCVLLQWSKTKKWDSDEGKIINNYGNPR